METETHGVENYIPLQRQRIVEVHPPGRERAFTNPASNPI